MKRILAILVSLTLAILLCACQATPEKAIVVQKESDRLIEDSVKDNNESTDERLPEQYGIPESYIFDAQGAGGKLNIHVDAIVNVPTGNAIPVYRVKSTEFSQKMVSAFFQTLCGDTEMYIPSGQLTKDQIRDRIINIRKNMGTIPEEELVEFEQVLENLEKQFETAPDTVIEERTSGELTEMSDDSIDNTVASEAGASEGKEEITNISVNKSFTGLDAYEKYEGGLEGKGRIFQVKNNNTPTIMYLDYRNSAAGVNFEASSLPIFDDADVNEESLSKIGLKVSEAKQMVQEILDKTNSDMIVDSIYLQKDNVESPNHYSYKVYCVRKINGISCSYIVGGSQPEIDSTAPAWIYEGLEFTINNEGIISMIWFCPIEVVETVNEDANMKPFSEIQEIFEKMMSIKYEPKAEFSGDKINFEIYRVTLSLHRIIEQNSNENGLMVPAWNFYGKQTIEPKEPTGIVEKLGKSFLTINAIDGSIIDTTKGY